MGFDGIYPLVMTNIAMDNGHQWTIEMGDLPRQIVIFHSYVSHCQRVPVTTIKHRTEPTKSDGKHPEIKQAKMADIGYSFLRLIGRGT